MRAVDAVSLEIERGEIFGLVGESGSGKSTLGKTIIRLLEPTSGRIIFDEDDITNIKGRRLRTLRKRMQIIFQDPYSSLNPRMRAGAIVREGLDVHKIGSRKERMEIVEELFELVGLSKSDMNKYPREFSGGQRQRIAIARAIALKPDFLVADEPTSALDVSVRAQILELLIELKERLGLTILFITHDLALIKNISQKVAIMYLGKIVEEGGTKDVFSNPFHPYTRALLDSSPSIERALQDVELKTLEGEPPSPISPPTGCGFHPRCPIADSDCSKFEPELKGKEHKVACFK